MIEDQASRLRQLVLAAQQRTTLPVDQVDTGPPTILVVAADQRHDANPLLQRLQKQLSTSGMRLDISLAEAGHAEPASFPGESTTEKAVDGWLVHVGPGYSSRDSEVWQRASTVLLVTSPDAEGVLAAYRVLKLARQGQSLPPVELVLYGDEHSSAYETAVASLQKTSERFLGCPLTGVTRFPAASAAAVRNHPTLVEPCLTPLAGRLLRLLGGPSGESAHTRLAAGKSEAL